MKKTLKVTAFCVAMALALAGCKEAPKEEDDELSAPKVGSAKDLDDSGGTIPDNQAEAQSLYEDASEVLSDLVWDRVNANASIRASTVRPSLAAIRGNYEESDTNHPISVTEEIGGGTIKLTGNVREKSTVSTPNEENLQDNTTYNLLKYSLEETVNGTITNVTVSEYGETYTFNGLTKNETNSALSVVLKTGSKSDYSDAKYTVSGSFALAFGNAFSVKRKSDGAGAKFIISYAANYGPKSWTFGVAEHDSAYAALSDNLRDYLLEQEATLSIYDDDNELQYKIKLTGQEALSTSVVF